MRFVLGIAVFATLSAAAANRNVATSMLPEGVWRTDGYGQILVVRNGEFDLYDETAISCVFNAHVDGKEAQEWIAKSTQGSTSDTAILAAGISQIAVSRLPALPASCTNMPDPSPIRNFEIFAQTFEEQYAFFKERSVDWNSLRKQNHNAAQTASPEQLFEILSSMIAKLRDAHVSLTAGDQEFKVERTPSPSQPGSDGIVATRKNLQRALKDYISGEQTPLQQPAQPLGRNRVWYGILPGNVGYVTIFAMGGFEDDDVTSQDHADSTRRLVKTLAQAFKDTNGTVVDLRFNQGGYDTVALELVQAFARQRQIAFRKHAKNARLPAYDVWLEPNSSAHIEGPVAVLIGEHTVSAAETATVAFSTLQNATLIGQATQGALSDVLQKKLPNGWIFALSNETFISAKGFMPEGKGFPPQIEIPVVDPKTKVDRFLPAIERAAQWIVQNSPHLLKGKN